MMGRKTLVGLLIVAGGITGWFAGCSVVIQDDAISFSVMGKLVTLTFRDIGPIAVQANEPETVPTAVRLFEQTPSETPPTGQMTLPSASVGVARRLTAKSIVRSQALPLSGTATIRFKIAAGQSAALCDSAVLLAEFEMTLTMGVVAIDDEVYDLSQEAIAVMMSNDVTICIEIIADFDGQITIGEYQFAFGGGAGGTQPPSSAVDPPSLPGGLTQVPIDNQSGRAVVAPVNKTIGGVVYGVVGVLEAQTTTVTSSTSEPSSVTVVPAELGLLTVDALYIATHSAFVPDVSGSVTLATLTVDYTDAGVPTTLALVTASNTAEWSYDRVEHVTAYGGVKHAQSSVLYSFEAIADSTSVYTGYVYSVVLAVDASRTISSISLSMADPATYATSRLETGVLAGWAGQALTAITLAGRAFEVPDIQACCQADGSCTDVEEDDCLAQSGEPQGEDTECASVVCSAPPADGGEVCCYTPAPGYVELGDPFEQLCADIGSAGEAIETPEICREIGGVPQGAGTTCATHVCDEDFRACCIPPGGLGAYSCDEMLFDECASAGWDAEAAGVHCDSLPCPAHVDTTQGCCLDDGTCRDAEDWICESQEGWAAGEGNLCADIECLGACCMTSGCCELKTLNRCISGGGDYKGFAVDCAPGVCPEAYTCYAINNFPEPMRYITVQPACSIDSGLLLSDIPGGGNDPTAPALLADDVVPGYSFPTREAAAAECCKGLTDFVDGPDMVTVMRGNVLNGVDRIILDECEASGACCNSDYSCTDASKKDCDALDGSALGPTEFQGPGSNCASADCGPPPEYVVWYTSNVCCWGAPHIQITDRDEFDRAELRKNWPGGGIDPDAPLTKAELQGGFTSVEDARAWLCPQFVSWTFHYWCGSHIQGPLGGNWQGTAGCSYDPPLPQADAAPEFNGCP